MSESIGFGRISLTLGIIALFAVLLYGNTAPDFPTATMPPFHNPFDEGARQFFELTPLGDDLTLSPATSVDNDEVANCENDTSTWFGCLATKDDNTSYVTLNTTFNDVGFNVSGVAAPSNAPIYSVSARVQCESDSGETVSLTVSVFDYDTSTTLITIGGNPTPPNGINCPDSGWIETPIAQLFFATPSPTANGWDNIKVVVSTPNPPHDVKISWVLVIVEAGAYPECTHDGTIASTTAYIGCQIISFGTFVIRSLLFAMNVAVFIGQGLWEVVEFVAGLFAIIIWLYSIPGMPLPIQLFVDVVITSLAAMLLYKIANAIRGGD